MKVITILGTRPEIIKLSPLIPLLEENFEHFIIHTGQHYDYEMDQAFFKELHLPAPKYNLQVGSGLQGKQTGLMLEKIEKILSEEKPDLIIVQGDTNTVLAAALAASKLHIKIAHVEAGDRNFNLNSPEEVNRIVADHVSDLLLAADENCCQNLIKEGLPSSKIFKVGNTVYDACLRAVELSKESTIVQNLQLQDKKFILVTIHRAENTENKEILAGIITAINELSSHIDVVFPIHPRTRKLLEHYSQYISPKVKVIKPLEYFPFAKLLSACRFCLSDSGGVQEEALVFNVPCLIPLNETCWPHLVEAGKNFLVGQTTLGIINKSLELLDDEVLEQIKQIDCPYDQKVSQKIIEILKSSPENILRDKLLDNNNNNNIVNTEKINQIQVKPKMEIKLNLKIGIFAYNFKHKKTQEGILNLFFKDYPIECIFAADPVELKFYQSKIRMAPKGLDFIHPKELAAKLNIPYHIVVHNSQECEELIKKYDLDVGIILGARILKDNIIKAFKIGVLNMHPGLLPFNRGLDNLKWAVLNNYKQGVSCHLISKEIDKGQLIVKREIDVHEDDTLVDVHLRLQNMEQLLMLEALKILETGRRDFESVPDGNYFKAVPPELEAGLMEKFEEYKKNYRNL